MSELTTTDTLEAGLPPRGGRPLGVSRSRTAYNAFFARRETNIFLIVALLAIYFRFANDSFATFGNMQVLASYTAPVAILGAAEVYLLICGEIDLSIGHVYAMAPFMVHFAVGWGWPLLLAVGFALAVAALVGLFNGLVTVYLGVPSFITTLGTFYFLNGFSLRLADGYPKKAPGGDGFVVRALGGYHYAALIWAVIIVAVLHVVLNSTRWGVSTFAVGGNLIGSSEAGIRVRKIKIGNFVLASVLGGFVGIIEGIKLRSFDPGAGGTEIMFFAVAAAVIGGTALAGGSGTVIGAFLGALFLGVLRDGITLEGVQTYFYFMILGVAILVSMILNVRLARLRKAARAA